MESLPNIPVPIGDIDLEKKAKELGIKFFIPTVASLGMGLKGVMVPASAIRRIQQTGFKLHGFGDFAFGASEPECYMIPDPKTLIQLPWKPECAWLAW